MTVVTFQPEHARAVERALAALHAERATTERWGIHSIELNDSIDDLEELRDRMNAEHAEARERLAARTAYPLRVVS